MNAEPQHRQIEELLGAYALDALEVEEVAVVEGHVSGCPRCRAELDGHREIAAALGNSVAPLPPSLWDRVADQLDEPPSVVAPGGPLRASAIPRPAVRRPNHRGRWAVALGAAAAAVAIALLGLRAVQTPDAPGPTPAQTALSTPGHQLVQLTAVGGRRLAEVVVLPDGRGLMLSNSLARLPASQTYQLWAMIGGRAISLGLLGRQPAVSSFTVSTSARPVALAVTVEPAGGVSAPDRAPVASGAVPT